MTKKPSPKPSRPSDTAIDTNARILHADLSRLKQRADLAAAALAEAEVVVNRDLAARLAPLRAHLDVLNPALLSLDRLMVQQHAASIGADVDGAPIDTADVLTSAAEHAPEQADDIRTLLACAPSGDALERATADLYDAIRVRGDATMAAIDAAEKRTREAVQRRGKEWGAHGIALAEAQRRVNRKILNLQAARVGRPLPFSGVGTPQEVHDAAAKVLAVAIDYATQAAAIVAELHIPVDLAPVAEEIITPGD